MCLEFLANVNSRSRSLKTPSTSILRNIQESLIGLEEMNWTKIKHKTTKPHSRSHRPLQLNILAVKAHFCRSNLIRQRSPAVYTFIVSRLVHCTSIFVWSALLRCWFADEKSTSRSSTSRLLNVRPSRLVIVGDRSFSTAGPRLCNSLPEDVQSALSLTIFRRQLKRYLFGNRTSFCSCFTLKLRYLSHYK